MYKHIEFLKLKDFADGCDKETNILRLKVVAESFVRKRKLDGLLSLEVGVCESDDPNSADMVIYTEFDSEQVMRTYVRHPSRVANLPTFWDLTDTCTHIHYDVNEAKDVVVPSLLSEANSTEERLQ